MRRELGERHRAILRSRRDSRAPLDGRAFGGRHARSARGSQRLHARKPACSASSGRVEEAHVGARRPSRWARRPTIDARRPHRVDELSVVARVALLRRRARLRRRRDVDVGSRGVGYHGRHDLLSVRGDRKLRRKRVGAQLSARMRANSSARSAQTFFISPTSPSATSSRRRTACSCACRRTARSRCPRSPRSCRA